MRERIEQFAAERHNHERARVFGAPVLRSRHSDALLVGYSITGENHPPRRPYDRIVEANHIVLSSVDSPEPVSFTTRSWKVVFSDHESLLHAMDDLGNSTPRRMERTTRGAFAEALEMLGALPRREARVEIDGDVHIGDEFEHLGSVFVRLPGFGGAEMITIAAPRAFIEAGFASDVPE